MSDIINFTQNAAQKVWDLICEEANYDLKLRVYITGGGCSGFQYGFTFDENIAADDTVIVREISAVRENKEEKVKVHLLVDSLSVQYLNGAEIDYKVDIEGEQFIIRNPNAKTTCGCGSSFTIDE